MIIKPQTIIIFFSIFILPSITTIQSSTNCTQSCGGGGPPATLQYPFGFSAGCPIQLNCSAATGAAVIGDFPVQSATADGILVNIPVKCGRPIETVAHLFTRNYAPTSHNGILLNNCTTPITGCMIPNTTVQTNFQLLNCDSNSNKSNNISCYSEKNNQSDFIDFGKLMGSGCGALFSAMSTEAGGNGAAAVVVEVQVVKLGWWVEGDCSCSENANCEEVASPVTRGIGYRCRCLDGFVGDGFRAGFGCRKASSKCSPATNMSDQCGGTSTRVGILVGGVAAGASLMISVGLICCYFRRRSKLKSRKRICRRLSESTGITIPIYPYKEIERATNFFSDKQRLGTGAYGTVYAGKLTNDQWVAFKRIKNRDIDSADQVINEIKLLSSVDHPNLVRLLGCCIENGEQILVYEFMPNGTLSQHLRGEKSKGLLWPVRLKIAMETAQAIAFLHCENPPIYHRDIKSSNILLDHNLKSKVADFGLSRLGLTESSHISTAPQGTPGYLDPQYHQNFHLSDKSDVYSFGVVLVEIITALKAVDFSRPQNEVNLAALATDRIGNGRLEEIIDPVLGSHRDEWTLLSMHKVAELAFRCLAYEKDMRPSMIEVATELEQIGLGQIADSPEASSSFSYSSNVSEKPSGVTVKKPELASLSLLDRVKGLSPVSVQDHWSSERSSSPSSNSLLSHIV